VLEVIDQGYLLSVQDSGRTGLAQLGVPPSGAADWWGLGVANALAEAPPGGAAIEVTLAGAELLAVETCTIALAGADLAAERDDGMQLATDAVHRLPSGSRVRFAGSGASTGSATPTGSAAPTGSSRGMRAYVGLAGGVDVPRVLGSASTLAVAHLGGLDGRALRPGDRLLPVRRGDLGGAGRRWPTTLAPHPAMLRAPLAFVPGPDLRDLPDDMIERLVVTRWQASSATDRMGIRLDGTALPAGREILSHPVIPGSIQLPADGRPIVLGVDGPTIGGYPVVGVIPRFELPRLGQVRPGEALTFVSLPAAEARRAWVELQGRFRAAFDALEVDDVWHRLAPNADG
jgi:allophanate hydrolase subunit 2